MEAKIPLIVVEKQGAVGVAKFNEPERRNPLSTHPGGSEDQLCRALLDFENDEDVRAIVITGSGPAFCGGADIRTVGGSAYSIDERLRRAVANPNEGLTEDRSWALWNILERYSKPLIAAVNGFAIGGGWDLALWCDMIIADQSAVFQLRQMELGLIPIHASIFLTRILGPWKTSELVFTSKSLAAAEAERLGLVNSVVPDGTCLIEAIRIGEKVAEAPPLAATLAKQAIRRSIMNLGEWRSNQRDYLLLGFSESSNAAKAKWANELKSGPR
jgi:enoyl-CoA hydratase/carnithine racemase